MLGRRRGLIETAAIVACAVLAGCGDGKPVAQPPSAPPAPKVSVSKPVTKMVANFDEYVGRFTALDYVEIRARVSGYLDSINFTDGQLVKTGDKLFSVDKRPFEAQLDQAKAAQAQAQANLSFADSDLKRGQSLARNVITQQSLDQRTQASRVATASVTAQQAAVRQAELDLQFTDLTAPVSGRIGDRRVSVGNLVTGGTGGSTTLLATIASIDPIRFEFTMDEASYLRYLRNAPQGTSGESNRGLTQPVRLKLIDEADFVHEGQIDFVDNTIDQSTGTIRGRAQFKNPEGKLTPGMFGRIRIEAAKAAEALLVPDTAIGTEQVKKFVYAVGADNVASPKYVTLGPVVDGLRVVTTGLDANDTIIVNGLMKVRPGSKVTPEQATADAATTPGSAAPETSTKTN